MKENKPLVSLWILMYNNSSDLKETVDSVLMQDYEEIEVLFSDDGSTKIDRDAVEKEAERVRKKYPEVRVYFNPENVGTVAHINSVIERSKGKYFVSCCPGDRFHSSDTVRCIAERIEKKHSLMLTTRRNDIYPDRISVKPPVITGTALRFAPRLLCDYMLRKRNLISGCCTFTARELFERYGKYDTDYRLLEDYPYVIDLLRNGARIDFMNLVTIDHSIGGVSTGKIHPLIWKDIVCMRKKLLKDPHGLMKRTVSFLAETQKETSKEAD